MYTRILVSIDGSPTSNLDFDEAIKLAKDQGADGGCLTRVKCAKAPDSSV